MAGKILIVDDVATNRIVLKVKLSAACYETVQAVDGAGALRTASELQPDLILLDLMLPDIEGVEVLRRLRADPLTRDIPVIIITARQDRDAKMRALHMGADEFLSKPIDDQMLLARLRSLLRAREVAAELQERDATCRELGFAEPEEAYHAPGTVALVTDRPELAMRWRREIAPHLADRLIILSRQEALADGPAQAATDVFVISADLAQRGDGLRLMSDLRSRAATRHAGICIVLPEGAPEIAEMAFDLGANDLVENAFDAHEMALRLATLLRRKRQTDRLRASVSNGLRLAVIDPLTGLYNRRYAIPHLARIAERARGSGQSFAVMAIDLDRFKQVNDTWGHAAGDAVLVEVARRLSENLRAADLIARIGGEEFLVAMPDTSPTQARLAAERLCEAVQATAVALPGDLGAAHVTISIGLALEAGGEGDLRRGAPSVDDMMDRADRALLGAKADGRNQVTISRTAA